MTSKERNLQYLKPSLLILIMLVLFNNSSSLVYDKYKDKNKEPDIKQEETIINEELSEIENTIKITFVGNLVLSDSQYNYVIKRDNFDYVYKYINRYFEQSDYVVGFLSSKIDKNYSEKLERLGVNLLSISYQEMLKNGKDEVFSTIETLEQSKINFVGAYRNNEEKKTIKIVQLGDIKIGVLSYIDKIDGYSLDDINENYPYITSLISADSKYYSDYKKKVEEDFDNLKEEEVDIILVFSNMSQEYKNSTSLAQDNWNQIFIENGADIILGNYSTSVQPIEYRDGAVIINSAGTMASNELSSLVNIYIDKETKEVLTSSIVPVYMYSNNNSFRIVPLDEILTESELSKVKNKIGVDNINSSLDLITEIMFGKSTDKDIDSNYYYYTEEDYKKIQEMSLVELNEEYKNKEIYKLISDAKSITFIGDSITAGTKNKKHPWYEGLVDSFNNKKIINISKGGYTVKRIIKDYKKEILASKSDLYVVALGINDIRYRKKDTCAMNGQDYVNDIEELIKLIKKSNKKAKIVLIPPWTTLPGDKSCVVDETTKVDLINSFSDNLKKYADKNGYVYINPNQYLNEFFEENDFLKYMVDVVHPNSTTGVILYSKAIFEGSK